MTAQTPRPTPDASADRDPSAASDTSAPSAAPAGSADSPVIPNGWRGLSRYTPARIALGRSGVSQPTAPQLAFQLAHAQARDAVHRALDAEALTAALAEATGLQALSLHSAASDRHVYLQRPDLGRRLDEPSRRLLGHLRDRAGPSSDAGASADAALPGTAASATTAAPGSEGRVDLAVVVADGLSALAVERHALPFLTELRRALPAETWRWAPAVVVQQGRVAVGDEIGAALGADLVVVLIGERPGLSSPDSMGLYLTWSPQPGRTDAERNCISNVRPAGLAIPDAVRKLAQLLTEARRRQLTGVALKDDSDDTAALPAGGGGRNFLLEAP